MQGEGLKYANGNDCRCDPKADSVLILLCIGDIGQHAEDQDLQYSLSYQLAKDLGRDIGSPYPTPVPDASLGWYLPCTTKLKLASILTDIHHVGLRFRMTSLKRSINKMVPIGDRK